MLISVVDDNDRIKQGIALFASGIMHAVLDNSITLDQAWNWLLNLHMLDYVELVFGEDDVTNIIHLGTELEDVKRIIPDKFVQSCDTLIELCKKVIQQTETSNLQNDYYLKII